MRIVKKTEANLLCRPTYGSKKIVRIPSKLTEDLAYFIGVILGDGCITSKKYRIIIEKGNKKYMETTLKKLFADLFDLSLRITPYRNYWRMQVRNKALWTYLNKVFEIPRGKKTEEIRVPNVIKKETLKIQNNFLAGVLDTDGGKRGRTFGFTSANKNFRDEIIEILNKNEIIPIRDKWYNKNYQKSYYGWRLKNKDISIFLNKIELRNDKKIAGVAERPNA